MAHDLSMKFSVDSKEVSQAVDEIIRLGTASKSTAKAFEQGFRQVVRWQEKFSAEQGKVNAKLEEAHRKQELANKSARDSARVFEADAKALERLRQKYDQGHVAMEIYSRELNDLGTALKRNIITKGQYTKELERLNTATKMGTVVSSEFGGVAGQTGRHMSRSGVMVQQAGYQIGDFIVQVQSGQNAMVAFGQQATQMAGTLTMLGGKMVAIGTGLGIVIPLVTAAGAAFLKARGSAENLKDSLEGLSEFNEDFKDFGKGFGQDLIGNIEAVRRSFGDLVADVYEARIQKVQSGLSSLFSGGLFSESFAASYTAIKPSELSVFDKAKMAEQQEQELFIQKQLNTITSQRVTSQEQLNELFNKAYSTLLNSGDVSEEGLANLQKIAVQNGIVLGLRKEISAEEQRAGEAAQEAKEAEEDRAAKIAQGFYNAVGMAQTAKNATAEYQQEMIGVFEAAKSLREELGEATYEAIVLSGVDTVSGIEAAAEAALKLSDRLGLSLGSALQIQAMASAQGAVGLDAFGGGGDFKYDLPQTIKAPKTKTPRGGAGASQQDALAKLRERIKLDTELLGKTKERQDVERAIANSSVEYSQKAIDKAVAELETYNQIVEKRQELQGIYDTAQSSMEDGFMAMVEGAKSVEDAFKDMARNIIKELYQVYVIKRMVGSVEGGTGIAGILGEIFGKASGGTVQANQPYLVGEKGPELIVPRNRGHVMNADLTANAMGGGGTVVVNQSFNFQANGDESVKKIIAQAAPSIANMAKQSVMDARRRGGAMKNTFG